jgi:hypothetical protein
MAVTRSEVVDAMFATERTARDVHLFVESIRRMTTMGQQDEGVMAGLRQQAMTAFAAYLTKTESEAAIVSRAIEGSDPPAAR